MKAYGRVDVETHVSLTSVLVGCEWSDSRPSSFIPRVGAGWTPLPVWTTWRNENSSPHRDSNPEPLVVRPVAYKFLVKLSTIEFNKVLQMFHE
jgi:hypothetical protein